MHYQMKTYRTLLVVIATFWFCSCYQEFHCPSRTEWKVRAKWYCNSSSTARYTCLFNEFKHKYEEACKYKPDLLDPGEQYVISHLPRGAKCKAGNTYQPFPLAVNVSSECVLRKSLCNDEGQVLFYNGSSKEDRSCRCDFENGYAFVHRPKHPCKCIPAMEDCSCYRKQCFAHFKLTADYVCIQQDNRTYISLCPDLVYASYKIEITTSIRSNLITTSKAGFLDVRSNISGTLILIMLGIFFTGFFVLCILSKKIPNRLYVDSNTKLGSPNDLAVTEERTRLKFTWSKPLGWSENIKEYRIYCLFNSTWEHIFTVEDADILCFCGTSNKLEFKPRTIYRFKITAYTFNSMESIFSKEAFFDTGSPPYNLALAKEKMRLKLTWSKPEKRWEDIKEYRIYCLFNSTWKHICTVEGVDNLFLYITSIQLRFEANTTYRFTISAFTFSSDESILSNEAKFDTGSSPYNLAVTKERSKLKLTWSKPEKCPEDIKEYRIYCFLNSIWENVFTVEGADNLCLYVTQDTFEFEITKTYRFRISACTFYSVNSILSNEANIDTGMPGKPKNFRAQHGESNGVIELVWEPPEETLFIVKQFELRVQITSASPQKEYTKLLNHNTFRYNLSKAEHEIYWFTIRYRSKGGVESEYNTCSFTGEHAYRAEIKLDVIDRHIDDKIDKQFKKLLYGHSDEDTKTRLKELLSGNADDELRKRFEDGFKNNQGTQTLLCLRTREGCLLLELVFASREFNDEIALCNILEKSFENFRLGKWELFLKQISFKALNKPAPPQSVEVYIVDNCATVTWKEPIPTFFKTQKFIIKIVQTNEPLKECEVPAHQLFYSIPDILPSTSIEFTIYTGICHSIRSDASAVACVCADGPTPPQNTRATITCSSLELSWNKPIHPILKFVKHFKIEILENKTSFNATVKGDTFDYVMSNYKPFTNYRFGICTVTTNDLESKACKIIEIQTQGHSLQQDLDATNERLRKSIWQYTSEEHFTSEAVPNQSFASGRKSEFLPAQAPVNEFCLEEENDSNWLLNILSIIGVNEEYRKTCQEAGIINEIIGTFQNSTSIYFTGSTIEGTYIAGESTKLHIVQCDETIPVIDHIGKTDQNLISLLTVRDKNTSAGYVKLQLVLKGVPGTHNNELYVSVFEEEYILKEDRHGRILVCGKQLEYLPHLNSALKPEIYHTHDSVISYRCTSWPDVAQEWLSRDRPYGWPTADTIQKLKLLGFFVVRQGHPSSAEEDLEWKIYFSLQERKLMFDLTDVQHKCYIILKLINRDILNLDFLTSYHWKTCLFYVMEQNKRDIWNQNRIFYCIKLCIQQMINWVGLGFCPHYFIPKEDLFDKKIFNSFGFSNQNFLVELENIEFECLQFLTTNPLCDYIRSKKSVEWSPQLETKTEKTYQEAVCLVLSSIGISALRAFNHRILEYCYQANEDTFCFIKLLSKELYHIQHIECNPGHADHTKEETIYSLSFLTPHIYTCLASNISAIAIQHPNPQVRNLLLLGSFFYFMKGGLSGYLKFISVLYAIGLYKECEWYLHQINEEDMKYLPSFCSCRFVQNDAKVQLKNVINTSNSNESTCLSFLPSEIAIIPDVLKYEIFRYVGVTLEEISKANINYWHYHDYMAVIDINIYYFLLKFLINRKLKKHNPFDNTINKINTLLMEDNVRHRDVAFNLMAWIYHFCYGYTHLALLCLKSSWYEMNFSDLYCKICTEEMTGKNNLCKSSKLHALVILYTTWFVSMESRCRFCFQCFGTTEQKQCSGCLVATYCSKRCQKQNWRNHKAFCKLYSMQTD